MIAKPRTSPKYKLMFFVLVPLTAILLVSFSYIKNQDAALANIEKTRLTNKLPYVTHLSLQKYCGVYLPTKPGPIVVEIRLKNNTLATYLVLVKPVPETPETQSTTNTELNYVSGNKFDDGSLFKNTNNIEFILNNNEEVTGCFFKQREGTDFVTYEFIKRK